MTRSSRWRVSGGVSDGFVLLESRPLACGVVHFEDSVNQHGGAACAVGFWQHLGVLAQLDLDYVSLLWTRVLCWTHRRRSGLELIPRPGVKKIWTLLNKNPGKYARNNLHLGLEMRVFGSPYLWIQP